MQPGGAWPGPMAMPGARPRHSIIVAERGHARPGVAAAGGVPARSRPHLSGAAGGADGRRRRRAEGGSLASRPNSAARRGGHCRRRADGGGAAAAAPDPGVDAARRRGRAGGGRLDRRPAAAPSAGQVPAPAGDHVGAGRRRPAADEDRVFGRRSDHHPGLAGRCQQCVQPARQHGRPGRRHRPHRRGLPLLLLPAGRQHRRAPGWRGRWPGRWPASCSTTSNRPRSSWATPAVSSSA